MNNVHFSSQTDRWFTPIWLYKLLDEEFSFDFDPALKSKVNWENNGLTVDWGKRTFCNPPYSDIDRWVAKAYREHSKGKTVVLLIPSRTDTRWWHDYCMKASEIRFIKGRITFEGAKAGAPFPSCLVVFGPSNGPTKFSSMLQKSPANVGDELEILL